MRANRSKFPARIPSPLPYNNEEVSHCCGSSAEGGITASTMRSHRPEALAILAFTLLTNLAVAQKNDASREQEILQIQQLIKNHDLAAARRMLDQTEKQFPADSGIENLRGIVAAQQGDYAAAESHFTDAIRRSPRLTGAYLNLGRLYVENHDSDPQAPEKALNAYDKVLIYDPKNTEANYQSAVLLLQKGAYQDSLTRLAQLPEAIQREPQQLSIACADYAASGQRHRADEAATELLANPDFSLPDLRQMLPGLQAAKRYDLIASLFEGLQKRDELSSEDLRTFGIASEHAGKLAEARAALEQLVQRGNLSVATLLMLARVAREQKDFQGALGYLAHARELEPSNAGVHYFFGLVCLDMNLIAEARNSFEKAVQLEPENASYNYAMGVTSAFRHDPAEAVPYFEKYLELKPDDPRGKLALGTAFYRAKDFPNAIAWLTQVSKIAQTSTTAHYYLGCIALQERRLDEARHELELALKANPNYSDALAELGQYYFVRKDYPQADKELQQALKVDPDHLAANFYLLNLYTRTGDARREAQMKRYDELQKLRDEKAKDFLRVVEVEPLENP
jgi:tetratricopeptide (TPR) repeat protein